MNDGNLLQSVEGLEASSSSARYGAMWELLQGEKEKVCGEISSAGSLIHENGFGANEREMSDEYTQAIGWKHRDRLEQRLRDIIDAQDRLSEGSYGRCAECGNEIDLKRLLADPAATLCLACRQSAEPEFEFHSI